MTPGDTGVLAMWFIIAAAVATLIRLMDYPVTTWSKENIVAIIETYVGALIAAVVGAYVLGIQLLDAAGSVVPASLVSIITFAIAGMAGLRAILAKYQAMQTQPPA